MTRCVQAEIDTNRVAVYLNIAAVCLATGRTGGAVHWCERALALDPGSSKARLRLAKAHLARHEHKVLLPLLITVRDRPGGLKQRSLKSTES